MTLHYDLDRLKEDLERKRKQLEAQMSESTLSSAKTDLLAVRLRSLSKRTAASVVPPGTDPARHQAT